MHPCIRRLTLLLKSGLSLLCKKIHVIKRYLSYSGAFYFSIGNIPPKSRSKLNAIYLVALAKQKVLAKYGMDKILELFIADIKKLVSAHQHTYSIEPLSLRRFIQR